MKDELQQLWNSQDSPLGVKIETISTDLETNKQFKSMIDEIQKAQKSIFWRDFAEVIASVIVAAFFLQVSMNALDQAKKIACYLIILTSAFICYKLLEVKKHKRSLGNPNTDLLSFLKIFRSYWYKEIQLIDNVLYWYIFPLYASLVLYYMGDTWSLWEVRYTIFIFTFLAVLIVWFNKKAAKKEKKWLSEIDRQIESLA